MVGAFQLKPLFLIAIPVIIAMNVIVYESVFSRARLLITVLPVEAGRAVLIQAPGGATALVDAGADASILRALGETLPEWQRTLDAVILTGLSNGETGGVPAVLEHYDVNELIRPEARGTRARESAIAGALSRTRPAVAYAQRNDVFTLGSVELETLWPPKTPGTPGKDASALVFRIMYGNTAFLMRGDISNRASAWQASLDGAGDAFLIASTAPAGTYISDGVHIHER